MAEGDASRRPVVTTVLANSALALALTTSMFYLLGFTANVGAMRAFGIPANMFPEVPQLTWTRGFMFLVVLGMQATLAIIPTARFVVFALLLVAVLWATKPFPWLRRLRRPPVPAWLAKLTPPPWIDNIVEHLATPVFVLLALIALVAGMAFADNWGERIGREARAAFDGNLNVSNELGIPPPEAVVMYKMFDDGVPAAPSGHIVATSGDFIALYTKGGKVFIVPTGRVVSIILTSPN